MKNLLEAKKHAVQLRADGIAARSLWDKIDEMIRIDWKDKPSLDNDPNIKFTPSAKARNTFLGAKRLLTVTSPIIKIPRSQNDLAMKDQYDKIERMFKAVWELSGKYQGRPVHFDLVDQLLRYDEFQLLILDTEKLYELHRNGSKAEQFRFDRMRKSTPYVFQPVDARSGFWEADGFGLTSYYRSAQLTIAQALTLYGEDNLKKSGISLTDLSAHCYHHTYWDLDIHFEWISTAQDGNSKEDYMIVGQKNGGKHDLPVIPIICQVGEASELEHDKNFSRQPLLYGVLKSNLWQRLNMIDTHMMTNVHNVAMHPALVHMRGQNNNDSEVEIDYSNPFGIAELQPGDQLAPLQRDAINKDMLLAQSALNERWEESSIYSQTFGRPLGGGEAFSTVALLSQSGRLPLVNFQIGAGNGIARAFETMAALMKDEGSTKSASWLNEMIEVSPKDFPVSLQVAVKLDAELPNDQIKMAQIAMQLVQADILPSSWILENVLNVNDPSEMVEEKFNEQFDNKMMSELLEGRMRQQIEQELMMQMQQQQQQQQLQLQLQSEQQAQQEAQQMRGQDSYGGLPPSAAGMIPATMPGEKPVPAGTGDGMLQEGVM